ncbi:hypothetical protein NDA16_002426 [Ustilago loliicola]|nr:hypothetical protein NDA16_002426 [Ustilago loliicola]
MADYRKVPRPSYDSQATASDATVDDEKTASMEQYHDDTSSPSSSTIYPPKRISSRYNADEDLEDGMGVRLDDDEEVGLMQADRDAGYPPSPSPDTAAGHYALSNTSHFQVDFQDAGWHSFAQAAAGTGLTEQEVTSSKSSDGQDLMPLDMDTVFGGTLAPQTFDLTWSKEDPDEGVFSHVDWARRDIWLEDVTHARHQKTGSGTVAPFGGKVLMVEGKNVLDERGRMLDWTSFKFSPDLSWVLFFSSETNQWRYSKKSHLWLHNIATKKTIPLGSGPREKSKVSFAAWARKDPKANSGDAPGIAFVEKNNLYFIPRAGEDPVRVTEDGAATIFNAVPDWVYEEEIFGSDSVMWFSPGGTKLVYLRLDETAVPVYEFPVYSPDPYRAGFTTPYQKMTKMKYPKPGFPNPIVSVKMIDLDEIRTATRKGATVRPTQYTLHSPISNKGKAANEVDKLLSSDAGTKERLVTEVKWVSDSELLVRETDRYSDIMRVVKFDLSDKSKASTATASAADIAGEVVRRQDARADKSGWIRAAQTIEALSHHNLSVGSTAYLDIVVSPEGYRHLAYYDIAASDQPIFLTKGRWEIAALKHIDAKRGRAYFVAARPTPALRNVYYVELPDWKQSASADDYKVKEPVALTDVSKPGSYDVSFDPKGAYYALNYQGPDVPYQKVVGVDDTKFELMLEENKMLREISSQYVKPSNTFYQLVLNSTMPDDSPALASVKEIRPHDFDPSGATKYPVLMRVYGGPDSQLVDARWNRADWHQYVASTLGYIVVVVDGRGTGFKGQAYRASVAGNLGDLEAQDVNEAAQLLSTLPYVDEKRIGLWGWSFGGYLTGKSVERDRNLFSLAISVAPVTKWEFYDSVYTERYMKSPLTNQKGYGKAAIHVNTAFAKTKYFLMQGASVRHAVKSAISRYAGHGDSKDPQNSKSMFLKECSLYTCFLLAGWVDATVGALLPAVREHWDLSFVLVSMLFVGTFVGCIIAATFVSPLMDKFGFGKMISGAAALALVFPIVFLTMPPFPVLIVAMIFSGMSTSTLDALVNVWISQRPKADIRLGFLHFLYGVGALCSPLAAIPFIEKRGVAFQYFFCISLGLATLVLTLVTVAFRLQRDEHVEGADETAADADASIELQPQSTSAHDVKHKASSALARTPTNGDAASTSHDPIDLMPTANANAFASELHPIPAPTNACSGFEKLKAVVSQSKVLLLAGFTGIYVGTEVTVGGWSSSYLIEARKQGATANALVSGFWAGIAFGRILLIPVTAWLGDEIAIILYLLCAVGLQLLIWFIPNIIANAVALALLGVFLGPAFPCMIRVTTKTIRPRAHLTAAISFISTFSAAGMALLPLIVGLASQKASQGIKILPPMLVGLLSLQVLLWIASNKEYFVKRFIKREDIGVAEDVDRLD